MTPRTPRKFTILDGMILVAAVAGGFALRRAAAEAFEKPDNIPNWPAWPLLDRTVAATFPFLVTFTPAVLVMRLRRPRPRWPALARQPGMAASSAALLPIATALIGLWQFAKFAKGESRVPISTDPRVTLGYFIGIPSIGDLLGSFGLPVGLWVLGAWLILALSGRRRPEKSWIDRLGRLIGIGWLAMLVLKISTSLMS